MKKAMILLGLSIITLTVCAQQGATTDNGKRVILNDNGTWKYDSLVVPAPESTEADLATYPTFTKPAGSKALLRSQKTNAGLWYNAVLWKKSDNPFSEAAEFTLLTKNSEAFCMVISERIQIPYEMFRDAVITNGKKTTSEFKVLNEEYRNVNGNKIKAITAKATKSGVNFVFTYYLHSSEKGTTQVVVYTSENLYAENKQRFEELLNGFVIIR